MGGVVRLTRLAQHTRFSNYGKVLQAIVARESTLQAIVSRIRDLMRRYGQAAEADGVPCTVVDLNGLFLVTATTERGTFFCVLDREHKKRINGYYDLREAKSDWDPAIDVIHWQRGKWEDALFEHQVGNHSRGQFSRRSSAACGLTPD